jgi:hypothetical protein
LGKDEVEIAIPSFRFYSRVKGYVMGLAKVREVVCEIVEAGIGEEGLFIGELFSREGAQKEAAKIEGFVDKVIEGEGEPVPLSHHKFRVVLPPELPIAKDMGKLKNVADPFGK